MFPEKKEKKRQVGNRGPKSPSRISFPVMDIFGDEPEVLNYIQGQAPGLYIHLHEFCSSSVALVKMEGNYEPDYLLGHFNPKPVVNENHETARTWQVLGNDHFSVEFCCLRTRRAQPVLPCKRMDPSEKTHPFIITSSNRNRDCEPLCF